MSEQIIGHMASFPQRRESMVKSLDSIKPQVDCMNLYLNDYGKVPKEVNDVFGKVNTVYSFDDMLHDPSVINVFLGDYWAGDIADNGKFFAINTAEGYQLTFDDDLIYPEGYTHDLLKKIEQYERKAVVSYHGRELAQKEQYDSYYQSCVFMVHSQRTVSDDFYVHVIGSGCMGFHSDTMRFNYRHVGIPYMADIWLSSFCQREGIPRIAAMHSDEWLQPTGLIDNSQTIYSWFYGQDKQQTKVINKYDWDMVTI